MKILLFLTIFLLFSCKNDENCGKNQVFNNYLNKCIYNWCVLTEQEEYISDNGNYATCVEGCLEEKWDDYLKISCYPYYQN